jgi:hypothetical protein
MSNLPPSYQQTLRLMPDIGFGESQSDYTHRILKWGEGEGISKAELLRCASVRWHWFEVQSLIDDVVKDKPGAVREALILLLTDRYSA